MNEHHNNSNNDELDCQVTVYDGAYITCDMIDEDAAQKEHEDAVEDYDI